MYINSILNPIKKISQIIKNDIPQEQFKKTLLKYLFDKFIKIIKKIKRIIYEIYRLDHFHFLIQL